jgi:8-oxo-dGTP pyrophosphatase MutT (NUDIX family)
MRALSIPVPCVQYAALPWRRVRGEIEILLVTTQTTRRWIIPKGWPIPALSPADCARHEAIEEAGVSGEIGSRSIGSFRYLKRRKNDELLACKVEVFALEVSRQRRSWLEKHLRETRWCSVEEAVARVSEPGLRRLIARFVETLPAEEKVAAR